MTLAEEDANSIVTDDASRTISGKVALHVVINLDSIAWVLCSSDNVTFSLFVNLSQFRSSTISWNLFGHGVKDEGYVHIVNIFFQ